MFVLLEFKHIYPVFGDITDITHVKNTVILLLLMFIRLNFLIQNLIPMLFHLLLLCNNSVESLLIHNCLQLHKSFDKSDTNVYLSLPHYSCD